VHAKAVPFPFNSALVRDCMERGLDYMSGGARFNFNGTQGVGIANVADSLCAVERLVYRERRVSLPELVEALKKDFEGYDDLKRLIETKLPRYGNDEEEVDALARRAAEIYCREVEKYVSPRGARYQPGLYPVSANVPLGKNVAASPDGRRKGTPLADGIAPSHGFDRKGPTAVLQSAARIDQLLASNGTQLNQKFSAALLGSDSAKTKFAHYLRGFVSLPVQEVQFNVVNRETLVEAQNRPEKHRDLVVRVAGYSAFFNDLDRSTQDDIIGRTEQSLG
jgi:formate C-acetyltransferase